MSRSSSPALRSLQISTDGKTLIGRSPCSKTEKKSPSMKKELLNENGKSSRKITSYFPDKASKILEEVNEESSEKESDEKSPATRIDVGMNTELQFPPDFDDEKEILEKLYSTGPNLLDIETQTWKPYWETCAKEIRQKMNEALLDKLAYQDEIEALLEEKRKLQEELDEYKEYFELREYSNNSNSNLGDASEN